MRDPITTYTRYSTTADNLADCWAFIMEQLDKVGERPFVQIRPFTEFTGAELVTQESDGRARFEVSVASHSEAGHW